MIAALAKAIVAGVWEVLRTLGGGIWSLVRSAPWWLWLAIALIVAGIVHGERRFAAGVEQSDARHRKHEIALVKRIAEEKRRSDVASARIVTRVEYRTRIVRERGATIVKEVPRYVPLDACPLPGGYRVHHNAAAAGVLPDPAAVASAAPVPAQVAAVTTAENYATCLENAEAHRGLLAWGCAHGWPVAREVCAELEEPSNLGASEQP